MKTAAKMLEVLREGNRRFVAGVRSANAEALQKRPPRLVQEHAPRAIVVGCSDARVPAEILFDQGYGDLFVVRVAGNVAAPSQIGSVEFAAETFDVPLVVVLGHSHCGAVQATLQALCQADLQISVNLAAIVDRIRPAVESLIEDTPGPPDEQLVARAVRANIRAAVAQMHDDSPILQDLVARGKLKIIGAEYSLTTGEVEFFDEA